ncbi:MAG: UvrD-helicase domain-containing protein [Clostridia bacterium]|nr:UvrD-helicase domain-containing protein [Clostridia bacterium]
MKDNKTKYNELKRALFERAYGEILNPEQCRAVFTTKGPLLVLAGAGSGKTTVLVNRISYMVRFGDAYFSDYVGEDVSDGVIDELQAMLKLPPSEIDLSRFAERPIPAYRILAFTFTNKAAREIKDRLAAAFDNPDASLDIWTGTFHSVCARILRRFGERLGYRDGFSIYDTDDKKRLISLCMEELEISEKVISPRVVASLISDAKNELRYAEDYDTTHDPRSRDVKRIYTLYEKKLMEYNAMDFDDLIMRTVELLENNADVREHYQSRFEYVLIDEYQDTNRAQFVLTTLLADKYKNIMVVGDDDQSIYRFRGATIENILTFDSTYPDCTVIKLEENYRSTENILNAANAVISNNPHKHKKVLWSKKGAGERITLKEVEDNLVEARYIVDKVAELVAKGGYSYSDFAVLYRVNALSRGLQTTFAKSGVPYKVIGDLGFYERKEIKDMYAYLSVINNPTDAVRLKRIINEPKRKIGDTTVKAVEEIASQLGLNMLDVMRGAGEYTALAKSRERLTSFVSMIDRIKETKTLPSEILGAVYVDTGYEAMLRAEDYQGETRMENVKEFIGAAAEYEARCLGEDIEPTLYGFLEEVALIAGIDKYDADADAVTLMTVHSAKGLEFPVVFLPALEDGVFPSSQSLYDGEEMAEERRLCYVAITRAKKKLFITHARKRMLYNCTSHNRKSRFVDEIPGEYLDIDRPQRPQYAFGSQSRFGAQNANQGWQTPLYSRREMQRPPEITTKSSQPRGAEKYNIERLPVGARVSHLLFGAGVIVGARDLGGDVCYEVKFDSGETKKLMATFAKLKKL